MTTESTAPDHRYAANQQQVSTAAPFLKPRPTGSRHAQGLSNAFNAEPPRPLLNETVIRLATNGRTSWNACPNLAEIPPEQPWQPAFPVEVACRGSLSKPSRPPAPHLHDVRTSEAGVVVAARLRSAGADGGSRRTGSRTHRIPRLHAWMPHKFKSDREVPKANALMNFHGYGPRRGARPNDRHPPPVHHRARDCPTTLLERPGLQGSPLARPGLNPRRHGWTFSMGYPNPSGHLFEPSEGRSRKPSIQTQWP